MEDSVIDGNNLRLDPLAKVQDEFEYLIDLIFSKNDLSEEYLCTTIIAKIDSIIEARNLEMIDKFVEHLNKKSVGDYAQRGSNILEDAIEKIYMKIGLLKRAKSILENKGIDVVF